MEAKIDTSELCRGQWGSLLVKGNLKNTMNLMKMQIHGSMLRTEIYSTRSFSQGSRVKKGNKRHTDQKGRNKTVAVCAWYENVENIKKFTSK